MIWFLNTKMILMHKLGFNVEGDRWRKKLRIVIYVYENVHHKRDFGSNK